MNKPNRLTPEQLAEIRKQIFNFQWENYLDFDEDDADWLQETMLSLATHITALEDENKALREQVEGMERTFTKYGICPKCDGVYSRKPNILKCLGCGFQPLEKNDAG